MASLTMAYLTMASTTIIHQSAKNISNQQPFDEPSILTAHQSSFDQN